MSEESQESVGSGSIELKPISLTRLQWWLFVVLIVVFLVAGQTAAVLLGRFYFTQGGKSLFMATLVQSSGFPILFIPLLLFPFPSSPDIQSAALSPPPPKKHIICTYIALGIIISADNLLYSLGMLYLSPSTYSLINTTQLVFNVIFSHFLNSHRMTPMIINSVGIVTLSAALLAVNDSSESPAGVSNARHALGIVCTLAASALNALLMCLIQFSFRRVLRKASFYVVVEMQIWTSVVAAVLLLAGLFGTGQWRSINVEMAHFKTGKNSYVMTLVWAAACWQVCSVGVVGLIFLVSALFSNVIATGALAVVPVAAVVAFHDKMDGVKIIAMLFAFWGLGSYAYQQHRDEKMRAVSRVRTMIPDVQVTEVLTETEP